MRRRSNWQPDAKTHALIMWALAGAPETEPLPEGAREILAGQRRAELFETWEAVERFGESAAEPLRQAYGFPEELTRAPAGLVTAVQAPKFADGLAAVLLTENGWADREWPNREELRGYLYSHAQKILWKQMRREDRQNAALIRHEAFRRIAKREFLEDVEKSMSPIKRMMPDLFRYCRVLRAAADPRTAAVDWSKVAQRYGIPEGARLDAYVAGINRRWSHELERLELELGLYLKRRRVCLDPKTSRFDWAKEI